VAVTEKEGAPGTDIIDVFVAVGVEDVGALATSDEGRVAADAAAGADGGVDAAGYELLGAAEERVGFRVRHR